MDSGNDDNGRLGPIHLVSSQGGDVRTIVDDQTVRRHLPGPPAVVARWVAHRVRRMVRYGLFHRQSPHRGRQHRADPRRQGRRERRSHPAEPSRRPMAGARALVERRHPDARHSRLHRRPRAGSARRGPGRSGARPTSRSRTPGAWSTTETAAWAWAPDDSSILGTPDQRFGGRPGPSAAGPCQRHIPDADLEQRQRALMAAPCAMRRSPTCTGSGHRPGASSSPCRSLAFGVVDAAVDADPQLLPAARRLLAPLVSSGHDPDDALPRADQRAQRDRAVGALVEPPGRAFATRCRTSSSTSRSAMPPACSTRRRSTSTGSTGPTPSASWPASSLATSGRALRDTPSTRPGATIAASSSRTASSCGSPTTSSS